VILPGIVLGLSFFIPSDETDFGVDLDVTCPSIRRFISAEEADLTDLSSERRVLIVSFIDTDEDNFGGVRLFISPKNCVNEIQSLDL
jgi:hypothetical protein